MSSFSLSKAYIDAITQAKAASRLTDMFAKTTVQREYEKAFKHATLAESLEKSLGLGANFKGYASGFAGMTSVKSLQSALASSAFASSALEAQFAHLDSTERARRTLENAFGGSKLFKDYAKALDITRQVKKLGADLSLASKAQEYLEAFDAIEKRTVNEFTVGFGGVSNLAKLRQGESAQWIRQLSTAMTEHDLYRRLMVSTELTKSFSGSGFTSAAQLAQHRYESLFSVTDAWKRHIGLLTRPAYLESLLSTLEQDASHYDGVEDVNEESVNAAGAELLLGELAQAETPESFAEVLSRCPVWLKWALINFLLFVVLPFVVGISVNLVTPSVQAYLDDTPLAAAREQVKGIGRLSMGEIGVAMSAYRFVTAQKLALRKSANSRSEQVDTLHFGQVVAVTSSVRDWTEVTYEYGDGEVVSGWVYTRYLKKFRR